MKMNTSNEMKAAIEVKIFFSDDERGTALATRASLYAWLRKEEGRLSAASGSYLKVGPAEIGPAVDLHDGHVVVDHGGDVLDIDAPRQDIGRDHYRGGTRLKILVPLLPDKRRGQGTGSNHGDIQGEGSRAVHKNVHIHTIFHISYWLQYIFSLR